MKKFLSILLSCSLICSNVLSTNTANANDKTKQKVPTSATTKNKFIYGLIPGLGVTMGIAGLITALILGPKQHNTGNKQTPSETEEEAETKEKKLKKNVECDKGKKKEVVEQHNTESTCAKEAEYKHPKKEVCLEESGHDFIRCNRVSSSAIFREYQNEIIKANPHTVIPKSKLRKFFKLFKNAPILFRGVHFPDETKALNYRKEIDKFGALVSSTKEANGGNIHGSNAPDGHATYFSSYIDTAVIYAQQHRIPHPDKYHYIVIGSLIPAEPGNSVPEKDDWAIFPNENERFVVCSDYIPLPRGISTLSMFDHMSDYEFKINDPATPQYDEESLMQIRELQVWLLRAGIVIERSRRAGHKGMFIGNFDPDKADKLLVKLGYTEQLAA